MQTVVVHIGMPKAGSTSIQASLNGYDDGTVRYARLGPPCHSMPVMSAFCRDPRTNFLRTRVSNPAETERIGKRTAARLRREVALGREALVVSGEAIGTLRAGDIAAMDSFFETLGVRMEAVAYIREPVGFASSAFQQAVKTGRDEFNLKACRPGYRKKYQDFLDVLGPGRVRFLDFRRENLKGKSVVPDFADRVGMDMARITETRENESLSAAAVAVLYVWNQNRRNQVFSPQHSLARKGMLKALSEALPGRFRLAPDLVKAVTVEEDVAWMERAGGFSLRQDLDAPGDGADAIRTEADLVALCAEALPRLVALLDELGVERPPRETVFQLMQRLFQHHLQGARGEVRARKSARREARTAAGAGSRSATMPPAHGAD